MLGIATLVLLFLTVRRDLGGSAVQLVSAAAARNFCIGPCCGKNTSAPAGRKHSTAATPSRDWPRLINRVEARALWSELGRAGWPYELRLNPGPAAYAVDWPIVAMGPEKHLGYAVQWFALGLALTLLYGYLGWRRAQELAHVAQSDPV